MTYGPGPLRADAVTRRALAGLVLGRIGVDGGSRAILPFLPVVAAGLDLTFRDLALLVALRSATGLAGPRLARAVRGRSRRSVLVGVCLLTCAGCLALIAPTTVLDTVHVGLDGRTLMVAAGFMATGLARPLFDIAAQSWIAGAVAPGRIGRATGIVELGWALSLAATVPAAGMLIGPFGWRVIGLLTAGYALVGAVAVARLVPRGQVRERIPAPVARPVRCRVPALVVAVALTVAAAESLLVVYGAWTVDDLGLSAVSVGLSALVIVAAELVGELVAATVADRWGLQRTVLAGLAVLAPVYLLLGSAGLPLAVVAVVLWFAAFELVLVALVAMGTAMPTRSRTRTVAAVAAAIGVGNLIGALLAPLVYDRGGMALSGPVAALFVGAAAAVLVGDSVLVRRRGLAHVEQPVAALEGVDR